MSEHATTQTVTRMVSLAQLTIARNVRTATGLNKQSIAELAESIKEHGLLQPILIAKAGDGFAVIAGQRRTLACIEAGLKEIPAIEVDGNNGADLKAKQIVENLQRENLSLAETCAAVREMLAMLGKPSDVAADVYKRQAQAVIQLVKRQGVDEIVAKRVDFLTGYQNAAYAAEYKAFVDKVRAAESRLGTTTKLTEAVARYLFKLMAYKDEYEVARLHTDKSFTDKIAAQFEGDYKLVHHLAPPLLAKTNDKGELVKRPFGSWARPAFGLLAKMKGLRGTAFDIFGHTEERKMERRWIADYRAGIDRALAGLTADSLANAVELARVPEDIRGYGHVKARHEKAAKARWDALIAKV